MKLAILAATALAFSMPVLAQETQTAPPSPDTMTTQDGTMPQDPAMQPAPATDPAMAPPPAGAAMAAPGGTMTQGGYAPAAPPMAGAAQPGGQVVVRPSAPVAVAFPPPPPKADYPVCSRTVQDSCRNPGSR